MSVLIIFNRNKNQQKIKKVQYNAEANY